MLSNIMAQMQLYRCICGTVTFHRINWNGQIQKRINLDFVQLEPPAAKTLIKKLTVQSLKYAKNSVVAESQE